MNKNKKTEIVEIGEWTKNEQGSRKRNMAIDIALIGFHKMREKKLLEYKWKKQ